MWLLGWMACSEQSLVGVDDEVLGPPSVEVSPAALDYGAPAEGAAVTRTLTVTNAGASTLQLDDVRVEPGFALGAVAFGALLPGERTSFDVFYASDGDARASSVLIATDDPGEPLVAVPITVDPAPGGLVVSPSPVDFGLVALGAWSEQVVTLENTGGSDIAIADAYIDGGLVEVAGGPGFPAVLRPGEQTSLSLQWRPLTWEAPLRAQLVVTHDAATSNAPVDVVGEVDVGGLSGEICEPDGTPAEGARVWVAVDLDSDGDGETIVETVTDAAGRFSLLGLPLGPVVVNVKKGRYNLELDATVAAGGGVTELPAPECLDASELSIAVVPGYFDDIGDLLDDLGLTYTVERPDVFLSAAALSGYDLVFAPCDGTAKANLPAVRAFVQAGGGVYVSDYSLLAFAELYPDAVEVDRGSYAGPTTGVVVDSALAAVIGTSSVSVAMDTGVTLDFLDADTSVDADLLLTVARPTDQPAIVRVRDGDGSVVFTSFHTSTASSEDITRLFEEIVKDL